MPAWLTESGGEHAGRMYPLETGKRLTIGRGAESDIVVANAQASRQHIAIWTDGQRWWVEDLKTKNGTLLNRRPLTEPQPLSEGDEVVLPGLSLTFRLSEETMTAIVPRAAPSATRTFLFADLRDYTAFVERQGDAAAGELVGEYRRLVRAEVARTAGVEVKTEGDSFFIAFESARGAVECAVGIARAAAEHTGRRPDRPIRVGIGVHAGEPLAEGGDYLGSAVNVAARLAQVARTGEVLVTDVVRGLLRASGVPAMTLREGLALKGIDDPPAVYVLVLEGPGAAQ